MGVQSVVPRMMTFNCKEDAVNDENTKHGNIGRHVNSVVLFQERRENRRTEDSVFLQYNSLRSTKLK